MKFIAPFVLLCSFYLSAQSNCFEKTKEVYTNIIESIGNKFPPPPSLSFANSERAVAFLSGNNIVIENFIIEKLCEQKNFEDKISYVIAHELAHHYLNHNWMSNTGLSYASTLNDFIDDQAGKKEQRKLAESQADLYAGFFGQIAGYNTLGHASETLNYIYESYNLEREIPGYPSFEERIEIIESKINEANALVVFFEIGNALLQLKEYYLARECYRAIINNNFNSREIYNNLGLTHLLNAISVDDIFSKYNYPIHLDLETRAETNKTRSSLSVDFDSEIAQAEKYFNIAIELDAEYENAKKNLLVLNFLKTKKQGTKNVLDSPGYTKINEADKADFKVIEMLIDGIKIKKIKKEALKGSELSQLNLKDELFKKEENKLEAIKQLGLDEANFIFGFNNTRTVKTPRGDKIKIFSENETTVFILGNDTFLIKTNKQLSQFNLSTTEIKDYNYFIKR